MADEFLTQQTEDTAPSLTDLAYTVKDPGGTPLSRKSTWQTILNLLYSLTAKTTLTGADTIPLTDSAASNAAKKITWTNFLTQIKTDYIRYIYIRVVGATTDWSADGTTSIGGDFECPIAGTITEIGAFVDTAGTTGTAIVDVNLNGSTIMTTNKLKWDSTEKSTRTYSGTAPGLTTTAVVAGDIFTVDIDTNHTTKSKGLTIRLGIKQT